MPDAHPAAELAPRDLVSRTVHHVMRERGETSVWLDATGIELDGGPGTLARRFPHITATATALGYDWSREPIPVAPAAHYTMGGVATDLDGRTTVPGLLAAGEVACTGVHGANRLASNSLLEGLVFGERAGRAALAYAAPVQCGGREWELQGSGVRQLLRHPLELPERAFAASDDSAPDRRVVDVASGDSAFGNSASDDRASDDRASRDPAAIAAGAVDHDAAVRSAAEAGLGIERDAEGLGSVRSLCSATPGMLAELAAMIAVAAEARTESRGAHQRADHFETDARQARRNAWRAPSRSPRMPSLGSGTISTSNSISIPRPHPASEQTPLRPSYTSPATTSTPNRGSLASC